MISMQLTAKSTLVLTKSDKTSTTIGVKFCYVPASNAKHDLTALLAVLQKSLHLAQIKTKSKDVMLCHNQICRLLDDRNQNLSKHAKSTPQADFKALCIRGWHYDDDNVKVTWGSRIYSDNEHTFDIKQPVSTVQVQLPNTTSVKMTVVTIPNNEDQFVAQSFVVKSGAPPRRIFGVRHTAQGIPSNFSHRDKRRVARHIHSLDIKSCFNHFVGSAHQHKCGSTSTLFDTEAQCLVVKTLDLKHSGMSVYTICSQM